MSQVTIRQEGPGHATAIGPGGATVATLEPNDWETEFFGWPIGRLVVALEEASRLPTGEWPRAVGLLAIAADAFRLTQTHLDVRHLRLAPALEEAGFRLVDTRISFVTRLDRRALRRFRPSTGRVRLAVQGDLPRLLALTRARLTDNTDFHSRYKDPTYFTPEEAARWFDAWVKNNLGDPRGHIAVWEVEGGVVGFFGYQQRGEREGLPLYKSTLAAVEEARRGQKAHLFLQTSLFDEMPADEFWVENTTQLTNSPIIHNSILLGRRIDRVELTFFRAAG